MTVISTWITKNGTVHATDSMLTVIKSDGHKEPQEWKKTKIVPVQAWRGAMSYYGLAKIADHWSTLDWLRDQAARADRCKSPEHFAESIASGLNTALVAIMARHKVAPSGIGIHFSAYERVGDRWIPELFHIHNWADQKRCILRPRIIHSRETYGTLTRQGPQAGDNQKQNRLAVATALQNNVWFRYNNGDPELYNTAADAMQQMFMLLGARRNLKNPDEIETLRALARRPVEVVTEIQRDFCKKGTRVVGGRVHDLLITPNGKYSSKSGDV